MCEHESCAWQTILLAVHYILSILFCFLFPFKISFYLFIHVSAGWVCAQQRAPSIYAIVHKAQHMCRCQKTTFRKLTLSFHHVAPEMKCRSSVLASSPYSSHLAIPWSHFVSDLEDANLPSEREVASFFASPSGVLELQMPTEFFVCLFLIWFLWIEHMSSMLGKQALCWLIPLPSHIFLFLSI